MRIIKSQSYLGNEEADQKRRNYMTIGHDWYENKTNEGCAHLWFITGKGRFVCQVEGKGNMTHDHLYYNQGKQEGIAWKGRVDVCSKKASVVICPECKFYYGSLDEDICQGLKKMAIEKIHEQFGRDITIHNF